MDNWISLDANNSIPLFINASFIIVCQSLHCPYTLSARAQNRNSRPTNLMFHPNIFRFHSHKLILFAHLIESCPFMRVSAVVGSPCLVRFSGISVYKMARRISQFSWNVPFKQPFLIYNQSSNPTHPGIRVPGLCGVLALLVHEGLVCRSN